MAQNEDYIYKLLESDTTKCEAFNIIVKSYSEQLYWKIRYVVLRHEDANDVLQNTFMKAWSNIDSFHKKSKLITWLYSIAINEALDFLRKNKKYSFNNSSDDALISDMLMADDYFDGDKAQAFLMQAISTLPEIQRMVFNLRYFENMKYSKMSAILKTSEGALKASYHIAVKKISEYLRHKE